MIVLPRASVLHRGATPNRLGFDLVRVMHMKNRIDSFQETHFVIAEFEELVAATLADFAPDGSRLASFVGNR